MGTRLTPKELEELKALFERGWPGELDYIKVIPRLFETIDDLERVCQNAGNAAVRAQQATKDIEREFAEYRKAYGSKELYCSRCKKLLGRNYHQGAPGFEYLCMPCVEEAFPAKSWIEFTDYQKALMLLHEGVICDWGHCLLDAVDVRQSEEAGWLPVCRIHKESSS